MKPCKQVKPVLIAVVFYPGTTRPMVGGYIYRDMFGLVHNSHILPPSHRHYIADLYNR